MNVSSKFSFCLNFNMAMNCWFHCIRSLINCSLCLLCLKRESLYRIYLLITQFDTHESKNRLKLFIKEPCKSSSSFSSSNPFFHQLIKICCHFFNLFICNGFTKLNYLWKKEISSIVCKYHALLINIINVIYSCCVV